MTEAGKVEFQRLIDAGDFESEALQLLIDSELKITYAAAYQKEYAKAFQELLYGAGEKGQEIGGILH